MKNLEMIGFVFAVVIGLIVMIAQAIIESLPFILVMAVIAGAVWLIWALIKQHQIDLQEKEAARAVISAEETPAKTITIPTSTKFSNPEEKRINILFRIFLVDYNQKLAHEHHLEYLETKKKAYLRLNQVNDADSLNEQIQQTNNALTLSLKELAKKVYTFDAFKGLNNITDVKNGFDEFIAPYVSNTENEFSNFIGTTNKLVISSSLFKTFIFVPYFAIEYDQTSRVAKIHRYFDFSIESSYETEIRGFSYNSDQELAYVRYRYEKRDGGRDMRYNDNPATYYYYKGSTKLSQNKQIFIAEFNNKSKAINHEKSVNQFIDLHRTKYASTISKLLTGELAETKTDAIAKAVAEEQRLLKDKQEREERNRKFLENFDIADGLVKHYWGTSPDVELPEEARTLDKWLFGYKKIQSIKINSSLKIIGDYAFRESLFASIELPEGLESIGDRAFENCAKLESIVLPSTLTTIGKNCFQGCVSLKSITLPPSITKIPYGLFDGCRNLAEITLPKSIEVIENYAFRNVYSLKSIRIPDAVKKIDDVFVGCDHLEVMILGRGIKKLDNFFMREKLKLNTVVLHDKVSSIGEGAFASCTNLTTLYAYSDEEITQDFLESDTFSKIKNKIVIPSSVKVLGQRVFKSCPSIKEVILPSKITEIGNEAFSSCVSLKSINFPKTLLKISDRAFEDCRSLENIKLDNQTIVGYEAFAHCTRLKTVELHENTSWIKNAAFHGTPWIKTQSTNGLLVVDGLVVDYNGTAEQVDIPGDATFIGYKAFEFSAVKVIVLHDKVTLINKAAFSNCAKLTSITVPESVTSIAEDAFVGSPNVTFKCYRGSYASTYRLKHKILADYLTRTEFVKKPVAKVRTEKTPQDEFASLSSEEIKIILDRRKEQKTKTESEVIAPAIEYVITANSNSKVKANLLDSKRIISNNIFYCTIEQSHPIEKEDEALEVECFFVNALNEVISTSPSIIFNSTDEQPENRRHKIKFALLPNIKPDNKQQYALVIRDKNTQGYEIMDKIAYEMKIAFEADF